MPRPINKNQRYVSGLDGLRTIAVAVVVLYHLHVPGFVGGLMGVGVFFTLSGYLITANLMRSWDKKGNLTLRTFWLRRFRRLMPAVIVTLLATLILTAALARDELTNRFWEALSALFYVNNWHTIFQEKSYWDNFGGPSPLSHMWSLSVEEQFYLLWPLVLLVLLVVTRSRIGALIGSLLLTGASFAWMWVLATPGMDNTRAYEGTDTRAGGLLLGACLAIWLSSRRQAGKSVEPAKSTANLFGLIGLAGIVALVVLVEQESMFLYHGGLILLSVASVLAIFSVLHPQSLWSRVLGFGPIRWLGERSYGIYLWHMPVIAFMPQSWLENNKLLASIITIGVSVALAAISWTLIEDPIRKHGVIPPIKAWMRSRKADREVGDNRDSSGTPVGIFRQPFPTYFTSGAAVVLAAVVAIGATPISINPTASQQKAGAGKGGEPAMELDPSQRPGSAGKAAGPQNPNAEGPAEDVDQEPDSKLMSCKRVVHVGDSTSIGMFANDMVNDPENTAFETYLKYGAEEVIDSVFGARNTTEGWQSEDGSQSYPPAIDSVQELLPTAAGPDTCWVIATGVNDAANYAAGANLAAPERIKIMMDILGDQKVMWPTVTTNTDEGYYANSNMEEFNQALRDAQKDYPNLRIYDWAAEAKPEWFAEGDFAHYGPEGNSQRAERFPAALAKAYPKSKGGQPSDELVVNSGL